MCAVIAAKLFHRLEVSRNVSLLTKGGMTNDCLLRESLARATSERFVLAADRLPPGPGDGPSVGLGRSAS